MNKGLFWLLMVVLLPGCGNNPWNNPYPASEAATNTYYASFSEQPKTLDPARAYSTDESLFIGQIYEPLLQYHYLKRPYTLIPLTTVALPKITYLDKNNRPLPENTASAEVAFTRYEFTLRPGIYYQPHPALAKQADGGYYYHHLTANDLRNVDTLADFPQTGTRELIADDYVYEIKRLASPSVQSPIFSVLSNYVVGFPQYSKLLQAAYAKQNHHGFLDLRQYPLAGAYAVNKYSFAILIHGKYPQFLYWLAMHFFVPIPWEADYFYAQPGMKNKNLTFDWYPIGTGPYMLLENNPNRRMVLARNPNFHGEVYPNEGSVEDDRAGLLKSANQALPFIDKVVFNLEKEGIPRWNKFLQGYYDKSAIAADSFEQAVSIDEQGHAELTANLTAKGMRLQTNEVPGVFYLGFNMQDPIVGGYNEQARKLRQAIAIALDYEEFIAIFLNGRGIPAQGPLPPGLFGYQTGKLGINPYVYAWDASFNQPRRKSIAEAKKLLAQAGYPNGKDAKTGKPLVLNLDITGGGTADDKAYFAWMREQFSKLHIELQIRDTQYSRFQEKVRNGQAQIFSWGWLADYPDPENFLFLLYGPNSKLEHGGENATNYHNPEFDKLFIAMRDLPNGPERLAVIQRMLEIVRRDTPWIWGFYPQSFVLSHSWVGASKPNDVAQNTLKYIKIYPEQRQQRQIAWNPIILWPLGIILLVVIIIFIPLMIYFWRKQHWSKRRIYMSKDEKRQL